jgi:nicotinamidase-related amidase
MVGAGKRALLIVDVQNGFCADGNLPVPGGDEVVPEINRLMAEGSYDLVVASQDWHPPGHRASPRSIRARSRSTWGRSAASRRSCGPITASRTQAMRSSTPISTPSASI